MTVGDDTPILPFPTVVQLPDVEFSAERKEVVQCLEALLFAAGEPVSVENLCEAMNREDVAEIRRCLHLLQLSLEKERRGISLLRVGKRWQLRTLPKYKEEVQRLLGKRPVRLSRAALEVLSIIAYQQPTTRSEIDAVRGVDCGGVVKSLLKRDLVRVSGRRAIPGRPLEYGTSKGFLELFGLPDLRALPTLEEYEELNFTEEP
jgi:segregation and condensation protein B